MKQHRISIAALVLVGLVAATVVVVRQQNNEVDPLEAEKSGEESVFAELSADDVLKLEIQRPNTPKVRLERSKGEDGLTPWRMTLPVDASVDETSVNLAVEKLAELHAVRVASRNADNHGQLEVSEETGIRVTASGEEDTLVDVWVGRSAGGHTMVRRHDGEKVFAVEGSIQYAFNKEVKIWRDRTMTDVLPASVEAMTIQHGESSYGFQKTNDEWALTDPKVSIEKFSADKVQGLVSSLARASAVDFGEPEADRTALRLTGGQCLSTVVLSYREVAAGQENSALDDGSQEDGAGEGSVDAPLQQLTLCLGRAKEGTAEHYLAVSGSDTVFVVSSYFAKQMRPEDMAFQESEEDNTPAPQGLPTPTGDTPQLPPEVMRQLQQQLGR